MQKLLERLEDGLFQKSRDMRPPWGPVLRLLRYPVAIDDNPKKWGYYTPGAHMRIAGIQELAGTKVDYLLLLAWNFQKEIISRCKAAHYTGGFILPVPVPTTIPVTSAGAPRT